MALSPAQEVLCDPLEKGLPSAAALIRQQAREIDDLWDRLSRAWFCRLDREMRVRRREITHGQSQQLLPRAEPATAPASWSCNGNPWQIALLGWNSATGLGVDAAKLATVAHERAKVLYGADGLRCDCTDSGSLSHRTDDLHDREQ